MTAWPPSGAHSPSDVVRPWPHVYRYLRCIITLGWVGLMQTQKIYCPSRGKLADSMQEHQGTGDVGPYTLNPVPSAWAAYALALGSTTCQNKSNTQSVQHTMHLMQNFCIVTCWQCPQDECK